MNVDNWSLNLSSYSTLHPVTFGQSADYDSYNTLRSETLTCCTRAVSSTAAHLSRTDFITTNMLQWHCDNHKY